MPPKHTAHSLETILTYDREFNRELESDWSIEWSTTHVPGMDAGRGGGNRRRLVGRRRLRVSSFALAALMTMHCRVASSALTGGFFIFMMVLIVSVVLLANPLRHFEVYLGQWSISGPGRAFRIIPLLDGIGIAICINAIIRAICCCCIAAMTVVYVVHSVSDDELPFKYCRTFELDSYKPHLKDVAVFMGGYAHHSVGRLEPSMIKLFDMDMNMSMSGVSPATLETYQRAWSNMSFVEFNDISEAPTFKSPHKMRTKHTVVHKMPMCDEKYKGSYPPLFNSPAYNYFYVELAHYRPNIKSSFDEINWTLGISVVVIWVVLWLLMIFEKIAYGRLIWNNLWPMSVLIPIVWTGVLVVVASCHLAAKQNILGRDFRITNKEIISSIADGLEIAMYTHSASTGTEIIHGKGLNYYASGHIDPHLNAENMWHSGLLLLLTGLHTGGTAACALADYIQPVYNYSAHEIYESTLWILPLYSKCTLNGKYSHLTSTLIFSGLTMSYMTVAFNLLKTALHTIFEYKVKLVFIEQLVVAFLMLIGMGLSFLVTLNGGLPFLESVDVLLSGIVMPFICLLELVALLYVYRSQDFISDMNAATEENACSTRIGLQWQVIPIFVLIALVMKVIVLHQTEIPTEYLLMAIAPVVLVVIAVPLRAIHNAYVFLRPTPRLGI